MRWPFVSRLRYDAELAALRSQYEALREHYEIAGTNERTERVARREVTRQFAQADEERTALALVNARLTEDLAAVREELAAARAELSNGAVGELRAQAKREKKRADRLQRQYDDAVGLPAGRIEDSSRWQPGYQDSKQGAAPRGSGVSS